MKRNLTLVLKSVYYDYKTRNSKDLDSRIGEQVKIVGDIVVGKKLDLHFKDGFVFKTGALDLNGFINKYNKDNELYSIVLCTKDISFVFDISDKDFKLNIEEQLKIAL